MMATRSSFEYGASCECRKRVGEPASSEEQIGNFASGLALAGCTRSVLLLADVHTHSCHNRLVDAGVAGFSSFAERQFSSVVLVTK